MKIIDELHIESFIPPACLSNSCIHLFIRCLTWLTYQILNMNHVGTGSGCVMVLNFPSVVFVLLTHLLHQRQKMHVRLVID